jgi:putative ABC transport system permease protein
MQRLDKDQPLANVKTIEVLMHESFSQRRFNMLLLAIFAGVAMSLAALGIYGVIAYSVAQRGHEIGIRMALGAQSGHIIKLVVRQAMLMTLAGIVAGVAAAAALTRFITSMLYQVSATDRMIYGNVILLLGAIALLACWIPARRAMRVNPIEALRNE